MTAATGIEDFKLILEGELAETLKAIETAGANDLGIVSLDQTRVGRLSRMDAIQQQAISTEMKERWRRNKRRLEAALERIQKGQFGLCCRCHYPLNQDRLLADPAAPFCADCQEEIEEKRRTTP